MQPIATPAEEREPRAESDLARGIERGRRRARPASPPATTQLLLSFIWPGLGQWHAAQRRRALLFAIPPLALALSVIGALLLSPRDFFLQLLVPSFGVAVIALVAVDGVWRVASIVDAWRMSRRQPVPSRRTLPLMVALSALVIAAHLVAGVYVQSIGAAGSRIFQGDRPQGESPLDIALGGPVSTTGPAVTAVPGSSASPDSTGGNECPVTNPGDTTGYGDPDDDPVGPDDTDPTATHELPAGPSFDPGASPPPFVCEVPGPVITPPGTSPGVATTTPGTSPGTSVDPTFDPGAGPLPADGLVTVLFVGIDSGLDRDHALTDTLMVAAYDRARDQVTMISIPRDTGRFPLYTGGYYKNRINTFLNYAARNPAQFPEGPIKALMREIGYIVGIHIDYYASTNLDGFPEVVDLVGGVDVVNTKRFLLHGGGATGTYLDPGPYHLDGTMARQYVRSRHGLNNSDWQRARRQQQVIAALAERVLAPDVASRLPEIIAAMANLARTNANPADMPMLLPILTRATAASAEHIVLQPSTYARRIPPSEVNGRYMTELNIAAIREMSIRVFGQYSRYASGGQ